MKMKLHGQRLRDRFRLIHPARADSPHIEFLETNHIGSRRGDDVGDALRIKTLIKTAAAMNIVSDDPHAAVFAREDAGARSLSPSRQSPLNEALIFAIVPSAMERWK
jgi:hypothetical protein